MQLFKGYTVTILFALVPYVFALVNRNSASSFAGSTSTAVFPPPNATITSTGTFFPDASEVGFAGPTPSACLISYSHTLTNNNVLIAGDEADAIATGPAVVTQDSTFPLFNPPTADKKKNFDVLQTWGNLAPWQSVKSFGLPDASALIPAGCSITQVHLLHRHGARYPTSGLPPAMFATALHKAATTTGFTASGPLSFLNTWTYKLGAEILTPFGRSQL